MASAWSLVLLLVAVAGLLAPQLRAANWVPAVALAGVAVAGGLIPGAAAGHAVRPLLAPLAFVLLAVPMAVMLDAYGLFDELARIVAGGRRYLGVLWILAAVVTATLNLDVAVVLLSPLYVRVAQHRGVSPFALALQPALLASLASSALPVSNLTNLIATARDELSSGAFLVHLGLPTLVAAAVGWWSYRAAFHRLSTGDLAPAELPPGVPTRPSPEPGRPARTTLAVGGALVVALIAGFFAVPGLGGQPYEVVAGADLVLVALTRSLPVRTVPWQAAGIVLGLGVLASGAERHLGLDALLSGGSLAGVARTTALASVGANVLNNLPALLVALPATGRHASWAVWALLFGTNVGPVAVPTGSLAVMLWLATVRRLGVPVRDRDYLRVGWRLGLPAFLAGGATLLFLRILVGGAG